MKRTDLARSVRPPTTACSAHTGLGTSSETMLARSVGARSVASMLAVAGAAGVETLTCSLSAPN
jgi:hypothetical protein